MSVPSSATLERWIIGTLAHFNVTGERREGRVGIWVKRPDKGEGKEDKIAAIGLRVSRWVTTHGLSLNVEPDLSHYAGIVPCGISSTGSRRSPTSVCPVAMADADTALESRSNRCSVKRGALQRRCEGRFATRGERTALGVQGDAGLDAASGQAG